MKTILLVDDDASILRAWERLISGQGYRVQKASDGEAGYATAISVQPDLIIVDRDMLGVDGIELCRRLKANREFAAVRLVLTSADGEPETSPILWDAFWQKPMPGLDILASIHRLLDI